MAQSFNAVAQSFFAPLKREIAHIDVVQHGSWSARDAARSSSFAYVEALYNPRRRHSTPGYVGPTYEEAHPQLALA